MAELKTAIGDFIISRFVKFVTQKPLILISRLELLTNSQNNSIITYSTTEGRMCGGKYENNCSEQKGKTRLFCRGNL
jgi:hypothetical protein